MPKVIDHAQRRREIIEVAKRLIAEGGFEAATMRSIVTAAGFANGALKHYFAGKDEIIAATFESVLAETTHQLSSMDVPAGPVDALRSFIAAVMPLDAHRITSARVLLVLWEHSVANPDLARRYRDLLTTWRAELVARVTTAWAGASAAEVEVLADEIISATIGANVASLMYPVGELVDRYRAYVESVVQRITR
ncbi:MAG: TetR/AcrR family transcriptional regulator [Saccharothrix sp.]|nr:TetR/AcrR family transcriptional regulator [Saccharothrix sp.]